MAKKPVKPWIAPRPSVGCGSISKEDLTVYASGGHTVSYQETIESHLARCSACRKFVRELADVGQQ